MSKRPSIIAGLTAPAAQPGVRVRERVEQPVKTSPAPASEPVTTAPAGRRPKPDVVHTSIYIPKDAHRRLKEIALTRDVKVHDLIVEGINAVLERNGHAAIEPRRGARFE